MSPDYAIEKMSAALRLLVPYLLALAMFVLDTVSVAIPQLSDIRPSLTLLTIFYWSIYRPTLFPVFIPFLAGLMFDVLANLPLGLTAIIFVLVQWLVRSQRRFLMGQPYITVWTGFAFIAILGAATQWGLFGLIEGGWPPLMPVAASVALTIFLFPAINVLLLMTHRLLPVAPGGYP